MIYDKASRTFIETNLSKNMNYKDYYSELLQEVKTARDLKRLIQSHGGTLEEDEGYRDMINYQAVAPNGYWWKSTELQCVLIQWARGATPHAIAHNEDEFRDLSQRISKGIEPIPSDRLEDYATD